MLEIALEMLFDLTNSMHLQDIAHLANLSKDSLQLFMVDDINAEVNHCCLTREGFHLSAPHIDVTVAQARQNIF